MIAAVFPHSLPFTVRGSPRAPILAVAALALAASCSGGPADRTDLVLGTVCSVRVLDGGSEEALDAAFARLREIEASMSANAEGTVVSAINAAAGASPVAAPADVRYVAGKALWYAALSRGAFDPTIGPVVKLWNIGLPGERVPSPEEIRAALPLVAYGAVRIDDAAGTVFLPREGMLLDLGAIAKGYAADEVARVLLSKRVKAAVIDLGGNVKVVGRKPDGSKWRVGIQNPFDSRGEHIGIATLEGGSTVVTSGVYERYFTGADGRHYHHILDTRTGYPVVNGLVSVTVISSSSVDADGLSTTLFALGLEEGMALAESLEHVEAVFIDERRRVYVSSGAKGVFKLGDSSFTQAELP
ncbi:MAG: FAD:protein FMN transferase [Spirochaetes bacterium]|nr:FAD:protein FMN transferase [Spirochaetota bacterium]MBU1081266.1 FAD:protein FMN transferase [Spirochaetota bacterium]